MKGKVESKSGGGGSGDGGGNTSNPPGRKVVIGGKDLSDPRKDISLKGLGLQEGSEGDNNVVVS